MTKAKIIPLNQWLDLMGTPSREKEYQGTVKNLKRTHREKVRERDAGLEHTELIGNTGSTCSISVTAT